MKYTNNQQSEYKYFVLIYTMSKIKENFIAQKNKKWIHMLIQIFSFTGYNNNI